MWDILILKITPYLSAIQIQLGILICYLVILYSFPANMDKNDVLLSFFTMQKCMQPLPYPYRHTHIHISDTGPLKITKKCKSVVRL